MLKNDVQVLSIRVEPHSFSVSEEEYWRVYRTRLQTNIRVLGWKYWISEYATIPFLWMSYKMWAKKIVQSRKLMLGTRREGAKND